MVSHQGKSTDVGRSIRKLAIFQIITMSEKTSRIEEYRRSGHYYIPGETDDLLWTDEAGEWKMSANARNLRSCMELDRVNCDLDESGYEMILGEFRIEPSKYKLEQIRYMSPLELGK